MFLMIDNYDSFTYNLVQYMAELGEKPKVVRNDKVSMEEISAMTPEAIIIGPGPKRPEDAGICIELIRKTGAIRPILGVCLGHQSICCAYGGKVISSDRIMHGKCSQIQHDSKGVFIGLPQSFEAGRYHSLAAEENSLPDCLSISARSRDGEIMGLRHKQFPVEGIQFHPESVLTPEGKGILKNFIDLVKVWGR